MLSCALWVVHAGTALGADVPKTLRFGLLPAEDAPTMVRDFTGIAEHVGKAVGLPFTIQVSQSYNALIEALRAGHLEVAYVGGSQYIAAREQGIDVVPLVLAQDDTGRTYYKASIVVAADSDIKSLADLKGKTFAFVSPTSTSGGVGPRYFLLKHGINPERDFKRIVYAGKHDSVVLAVLNKKVDAGAVGDVYFPRWRERGILKYADYDEEHDVLKDGGLRILGGQKVPGTPMIARGSLGPEFVDKLRQAFQTVPKDVLARYRIWGPLVGFKAATPKDFEELAEMEKLAKELKKSQ
jgi:phosphonate transport system substrate-binding protein